MKTLENRISSREVAEMMEVRHDSLLRKIDDINADFRNHNIAFSKYWIESAYKVDGQNREYKEYLITKRGCEFLAHKTTGTKGNLFTDKYMDRFEQMKDYITKEQYTVSRPKEELECLDVIAEIRQTGKFELNSSSYRNEIETVKSEIGLIDMVSNSLKLNDNSKLQLITKSFENHNINTNLLPAYTPSQGILKSATELLKIVQA